MTSPAPRPAIYVDALGKQHQARTVGGPDENGRTLLVIGGNGLSVHRVRYSASGEPATWHWPPKPS